MTIRYHNRTMLMLVSTTFMMGSAYADSSDLTATNHGPSTIEVHRTYYLSDRFPEQQIILEPGQGGSLKGHGVQQAVGSVWIQRDGQTIWSKKFKDKASNVRELHVWKYNDISYKDAGDKWHRESSS